MRHDNAGVAYVKSKLRNRRRCCRTNSRPPHRRRMKRVGRRKAIRPQAQADMDQAGGGASEVISPLLAQGSLASFPGFQLGTARVWDMASLAGATRGVGACGLPRGLSASSLVGG